MGLITKIFGTRSQRELKKIQPLVDRILSLEEEYRKLPEAELKAKTAEFKARLALREALREGNLERIAVDWQLALRRGVAYAELEQPMRPLDEVLEAEQREQLIEILRSINE